MLESAAALVQEHADLEKRLADPAVHADLDVAKAAGYPRPILHGLGTFGVVGHALLRSVCDYDPSRLSAMGGRFSAPVWWPSSARIHSAQ